MANCQEAPPSALQEPILQRSTSARSNEERHRSFVAGQALARRISDLQLDGDANMSSDEIDQIAAAIEGIEDIENEMKDSGFSPWAYFVGLVGIIFATYILSAYPEHFWLVYAIQNCVYIPAWWYTMHKVYRGALFLLDYCWTVNVLFTVWCLVSGFDLWKYKIFFAAACGPLAGALYLLHAGIIFHSLDRITSFFIHFYPMLVILSVRQHNDRIQEVWPGRFPTHAELDSITALDVLKYGQGLYLAWLVLHAAWLLTHGLRAPEPETRTLCFDGPCETVFNDLYVKQNLGELFQRKFGAKTKRGHAACYLLLHWLATSFSFLLAMACQVYVNFQIGLALFLFVSAAWNGAKYYNYLIALRYIKSMGRLKQRISVGNEGELRKQHRSDA